MTPKKQTKPLEEVWSRHQFFSGKASDHVRTSALAGLAVAWLFTGASEGDLTKLETAPEGLLLAAGLFAASLAADILHYFLGAWKFRKLAKTYEAAGKTDADLVEIPLGVPRVPYVAYNVKVWLLFIGYVVLVLVFASATLDLDLLADWTS